MCEIIFPKAMWGFGNLLAERIYFLLYTTKGQALLKHDFKTIQQHNLNLYENISTRNCRGYCYSICFDLCKVLEKGCLEFIAIPKFADDKSEDDDGREFTMHVLFLNNGWAFDTYNSCQYELEELHELYDKFKIYKVFDYSEFFNMSYQDFMSKISHELLEWGALNDCSVYLSIEKET